MSSVGYLAGPAVVGEGLAELPANPCVRVVVAGFEGLDDNRDPERGRAVGDGVKHVAADPWIGIPDQLEQPRPHPVVVSPDVAGLQPKEEEKSGGWFTAILYLINYLKLPLSWRLARRSGGQLMLTRTAMTRGLTPKPRIILATLILAVGLALLAMPPQAALAGTAGTTSITAGCRIDSGEAYCWGSTPRPVGGVLAGQTLTQISGSDSGGCALSGTGQAYCWGQNYDGQLGDGSTAPSDLPVAVDTSGALAGQTLTQISYGGTYACALDSSGAAYCWGFNATGELGDGSTANSTVPVAVDTSGVLAGQTITQVSTGDSYVCVLDASGAAFCWGLNSYGGLGDGTDNGSLLPVPVRTDGALAGQALSQISAGYETTCAVSRAGGAYCWGSNAFDLLGDPSIDGGYYGSGSPVPVAVDTSGVLAGQTLTQIAVGYTLVCAADSAGDAFCWGGGDLGNGGGASAVPVLVGAQAPGGVTAAAVATSATAYWTAPTVLDGGILRGYTATADHGGAACTTRATTCTITGLSTGTTYRITVVAHTSVGDSGASAAAAVTPGGPGPIVSGDRPAKCVDDAEDSSANDTPVVIGDCNGNAGQDWSHRGRRDTPDQRQVHGHLPRREKQQGASRAVDLHRRGQPAMAGTQRHTGQPGVGQVPGRPEVQHR